MSPSISAALSCVDDYDPNSLTVDRAREIILSLIEPLAGSERLFVRNALGRVLAHAVISPIDVPAHDNSAMDGYAVRGADLVSDAATQLRIVGTAYAGRPYAGRVGPGQAVRIMTGAILPAGGDTVVIQEVAHVEADTLSRTRRSKTGTEHPPRRRGLARRRAGAGGR